MTEREWRTADQSRRSLRPARPSAKAPQAPCCGVSANGFATGCGSQAPSSRLGGATATLHSGAARPLSFVAVRNGPTLCARLAVSARGSTRLARRLATFAAATSERPSRCAPRPNVRTSEWRLPPQSATTHARRPRSSCKPSRANRAQKSAPVVEADQASQTIRATNRKSTPDRSDCCLSPGVIAAGRARRSNPASRRACASCFNPSVSSHCITARLCRPTVSFWPVDSSISRAIFSRRT